MSYFDTASLDMHTELICLQRLHITYIHAHTHKCCQSIKKM